MRKLIALRKAARLEKIVLNKASTDEKRQQMVLQAQNSDRADELAQAGFMRVDPPTMSGHRYSPLPDDVPAFSRLGHLGAYIISVPSAEWENKAQEHLQDDYELFQNVTLSMPTRTNTKEIQQTSQPRQTSQWPEDSGISAAHADGLSGYGVIVGVLDTGCDADHDEFNQREPIDFIYVNPAEPGSSVHDRAAFDSDGHGTHVCGIVAGKSFGIAPDVDLAVAAVVTESSYQSSLERVLFGLNWILTRFNDPYNLKKPMIINMSLGIPASLMEDDLANLNRRLKGVFQRLLNEFDVLPIVAIGNDGDRGRGYVRAPGYYSSVLSVGAVDFRLQPAPFSSYGASPDGGKMQPDIMGYGINIYAGHARNTKKKSLYVTMSGTSMATPYVTGIAALYACEDQTRRGARLRDHLLETALNIHTEPDRVGVGLARYVKGNTDG